jgi:hypothetical protein
MEDGLLGPDYSFADEIETPSELGIGRIGKVDNIVRSVAGVNYYFDTIGFGEPTLFDKGMDLRPLGIRYFIKTGQSCHNGADMYEYISTVPNGLPGRVGQQVKQKIGVELRGLAPGLMEDAFSAVNPLPMFDAVIGSGYAKCKKVTLPVGDEKGNITAFKNPDNVWIPDPSKKIHVKAGQIKGVSEGYKPHQTRWVFDKYISADEYEKSEKTVKPGELPAPEGFVGSYSENPTRKAKMNADATANTEKLLVGALCAVLLVGLFTFVKSK